MVARLDRIWHYIGIAGTLMLIILWAFTRIPNPITAGLALPINKIGIAIEVFQISYIVIIFIIIAEEALGKRKQKMVMYTIKKIDQAYWTRLNLKPCLSCISSFTYAPFVDSK